MPSRDIDVLYRRWCTSCNDWKLFSLTQDEMLLDRMCCTSCNKEIQKDVTLGQIGEEKVLEQRERYKRFKKEQFHEAMSLFSVLGLTGNVPSIGRARIVESDAGLEKIYKKQSEERERLREENKKLKQQFAGLGRNEKCLCGSGKKYKKCCLESIQKIY